MSTEGTMAQASTPRVTRLAPKRSLRIPRGIRPRLPSSTGMARAMLTWTESSCSLSRMLGIIAETEPKPAKQTAKEPVARVSCSGLPTTTRSAGRSSAER